jgi:carboxypeptidase C (cathepsin A)
MPNFEIRNFRRRGVSWLVLWVTAWAMMAPALALAQHSEVEDASPPDAAAKAEAAETAEAPRPEAEAPPPAGRASGVLTLPDDQRLRYRATAETLPVRDRKGKTVADIFVVSYLAEDADKANRPVTFLFNGGPGAASAFLMLGAAGPKVLVTNDDGTVPRPPARLKDNPESWLSFTDLVFVDPVGTGFSRPTDTGDKADEPFWDVRGDVDTLSELVRLWLTRNERWASPTFLAGESYGGFRAVMMARALQRDQGVEVSGLVLVSPALEFSLLDGEVHHLLPWALRLPSMAASARAQGKAPAVPREAVERFALTDYLLDLAAMDRPEDRPTAAERRVAELLGLPERIVDRHDGRIPISVFAKELLRDDGRVLSLYEGSIDSPDPNPDESRLGPDPMLDGVLAPYATAFNAYVRSELGYETDTPYRILNRDVSRNWDWGDGRRDRGDVGALDALESIMALNPSLRVLVAHGIYDLVTPYFASAWLLDRMALPEAVKENARLRVYEGGHMLYMRPSERARLTRDVRELYESALAGAA